MFFKLNKKQKIFFKINKRLFFIHGENNWREDVEEFASKSILES